MSNPFFYGSPVAGERFTDREEQTSALMACMTNGQNAILFAPRRFGKTSLLTVAAEKARAAGGRVGMARLMGCSTREQVAQRLSAAISSDLMGWLDSHRDEFRRRLGSIRPGAELTLTADGFKISLSTRPDTDHDWTDVITGLVRILARVSSDRPVCLVIDEFQRLAEIDPGLPGVFKDLVDELPDVSLVFAGSKTHLMRMLTTGAGAPLAGVGQRMVLGPIAEDRMVPFLVGRAAAGGKLLSADVGAQLYRFAHGVPNTVQQLAFWAFEEPGRRIIADSVQRALERAVSLQDQELTERFEKLSPLQQRLLILLASGDPHSPVWGIHSQATMRLLGASANGVTTALSALRDEEVVVEHRRPGARGSGWSLLDSFLAEWIAHLGR